MEEQQADWAAFRWAVTWATGFGVMLALILSLIIWGTMQFMSVGMAPPNFSVLLVLPLLALPFSFIDAWGAAIRFHIPSKPMQLNLFIVGVVFASLIMAAILVATLTLMDGQGFITAYLTNFLEGGNVIGSLKVFIVGTFGLSTVLMAGSWWGAPDRDSIQAGVFGCSIYR